jgi:hypothetical protein
MADKTEAEIEADRIAEHERLAADHEAARIAAVKGAPEAAAAAERTADDGKSVVVVARRAMWRAGRKWNAGETTLTARDMHELGEDKMAVVAADPNFVIAQARPKSVAVMTADGKGINAHSIVVARRSMWRAGRLWNEGVTALTASQVRELGTDKIAVLNADPNFTVTQNIVAAESQEEAEAAVIAAAAAIEAAVGAMTAEERANYDALSPADKIACDAVFVAGAKHAAH